MQGLLVADQGPQDRVVAVDGDVGHSSMEYTFTLLLPLPVLLQCSPTPARLCHGMTFCALPLLTHSPVWSMLTLECRLDQAAIRLPTLMKPMNSPMTIPAIPLAFGPPSPRPVVIAIPPNRRKALMAVSRVPRGIIRREACRPVRTTVAVEEGESPQENDTGGV